MKQNINTAVWPIVTIEEAVSPVLLPPPDIRLGWAALLCFPHDWVSCCDRDSEGHTTVAGMKLQMSAALRLYRAVRPVLSMQGTETKHIHRFSSVVVNDIR